MGILKVLQSNIEESNRSISEMQHIFYDFANKIMNGYILNIDKIKIELTEIEFYYFDCDKHCDPYVHLNKLQKDTNEFLYVHPFNGSRGGIDLTFGNEKYYGGILIRGIKSENNYIAGPAKVKNAIKEDISTYNELQNYFYNIKDSIFLKHKYASNFKILHSLRIGLGKNEDNSYKYALYRFIREDYLNAKFNTRSNLKEISLLKAISKQTLGYSCNEVATTKYINENKNLLEAIKLWRI